MKVLHLISGGDTGGAKTHVHSLLSGLSRAIGVRMVCFTEGAFVEEARALGIDTQVFSGRNVLKTLGVLARMVTEECFDLIHCHGARGNMMGMLLGRKVAVPTVSTVHSDYRLDYLGRPLGKLTYGNINTLALKKMDYRIGVSDAMVDLLISRGFDPEKLFSIYNGLDFTPRVPSSNRQEYLASVGLQVDDDSVVVGIAARLNPVKDIATLIRAFALAHENAPQLRLLIAGDGEQEQMLKALCQELGIENVVCFAGWVSDTDSFYGALDINTLTSLSETFPYALTEGARFALPTVSSRVGGVPYLIEHGVTGYLFPVGEYTTLALHLQALAESASLRQRLGQELYEKAKREYSVEATIHTQLGIYERILGRPVRKKVVICGAYGKGNAGDDAILLAILSELRSLHPDCSCHVFSRNPKETRLNYRVNAFYTFNILKAFSAFRGAQLYINGGGSLMQDVTSWRSLWFYLWTLWAGKKQGCSVLMYGCGIGPISSEANRRLTARILNASVDAITLRDPHSLQELARMQVTVPKQILSADPTVTLAPASVRRMDSLFESEGLDPNGKFVAFVVRPWAGVEDKLDVFAQVAERVYATEGLTPIFFPIEQRIDVPLARRIAQRLHCPHHVIAKSCTAAESIGFLSRMHLVVSMRLHGLIFAAGQGVPLVGVVYDPKVSSFLSYVGQHLFLELPQLTLDNLSEAISKALAQDVGVLQEGVARLRAVEAHNLETAAEFLH